MDADEREIKDAIDRAGGVHSAGAFGRAARALAIPVRSLRRRLEKMGIKVKRGRPKRRNAQYKRKRNAWAVTAGAVAAFTGLVLYKRRSSST